MGIAPKTMPDALISSVSQDSSSHSSSVPTPLASGASVQSPNASVPVTGSQLAAPSSVPPVPLAVPSAASAVRSHSNGFVVFLFILGIVFALGAVVLYYLSMVPIIEFFVLAGVGVLCMVLAIIAYALRESKKTSKSLPEDLRTPLPGEMKSQDMSHDKERLSHASQSHGAMHASSSVSSSPLTSHVHREMPIPSVPAPPVKQKGHVSFSAVAPSDVPQSGHELHRAHHTSKPLSFDAEVHVFEGEIEGFVRLSADEQRKRYPELKRRFEKLWSGMEKQMGDEDAISRKDMEKVRKAHDLFSRTLADAQRVLQSVPPPVSSTNEDLPNSSNGVLSMSSSMSADTKPSSKSSASASNSISAVPVPSPPKAPASLAHAPSNAGGWSFAQLFAHHTSAPKPAVEGLSSKVRGRPSDLEDREVAKAKVDLTAESSGSMRGIILTEDSKEGSFAPIGTTSPKEEVKSDGPYVAPPLAPAPTQNSPVLMEIDPTHGTDFDRVYVVLQERGEVKISTIAKMFSIDEVLAEKWCAILEGQGLAQMVYPPFGGPVLRLKK